MQEYHQWVFVIKFCNSNSMDFHDVQLFLGSRTYIPSNAKRKALPNSAPRAAAWPHRAGNTPKNGDSTKQIQVPFNLSKKNLAKHEGNIIGFVKKTRCPQKAPPLFMNFPDAVQQGKG